jgi:hypothetical protein
MKATKKSDICDLPKCEFCYHRNTYGKLVEAQAPCYTRNIIRGYGNWSQFIKTKHYYLVLDVIPIVPNAIPTSWHDLRRLSSFITFGVGKPLNQIK